MGDIDAGISTIFARPRPNKEPFDPARPEHEALIHAGDAAVEPLVSAIWQGMRAYAEAEYLSREQTAIYWAVEDCVMVLGAIDTPGSRAELSKLLNADLPYLGFYTPVISALEMCKPPCSDLLPGVAAAASGPCVAHRRENLGELCRLAHRMGGQIPLTAEQTVKMFKDSTGEYALEFIGDYDQGVGGWPEGLRCAFFWFYGVKVEHARGIADAMPYYAASVLANPSSEAAAWSKFAGESPSKATAARLAGTYPLPTAATAQSGSIATSAPASAAVAPPAWYPDPVGRHEYRYWDGAAWTAHVADAGQQSVDPLHAEAPSADPEVERVRRLIADLGGDPKTALLAADTIKKIGQPAVQPLIDTLHDPSPDLRSWAARLLRDVPDERAVEPLIVVLSDGEPRVCSNAIATLGELRDVRAVDPLLRCLTNANPAIRCDAAAALAHFDTANVREALLEALSDAERNVRGLAALSLGELKEPRAAEPIAKLLQSESDSLIKDYFSQALSMLPEASVASPGSEPHSEPAPTSATTIDSVLASLLDDDHAVRKEAIAALAALGYHDPDEPRTFQDLADPAATDRETLARDLREHVDFDIAYVRAAYPTARSEDHANADVSILCDGVLRCRRKGYVLARLSSFYTWKEEWLRALDFGTAAVLLGDPSVGPGDMVQVLQLMSELFACAGLPSDAELAGQVQARYTLGPVEAAAAAKAARALGSDHQDDARWAADTVRSKLSSALAGAR
jgi:HEAT repeat protein